MVNSDVSTLQTSALTM